jgi:hypothetical protein
MAKPLKAFQVWFDDGSAVLLEAYTEREARELTLDRIESGQYYGKLVRVRRLDQDERS